VERPLRPLGKEVHTSRTQLRAMLDLVGKGAKGENLSNLWAPFVRPCFRRGSGRRCVRASSGQMRIGEISGGPEWRRHDKLRPAGNKALPDNWVQLTIGQPFVHRPIWCQPRAIGAESCARVQWKREPLAPAGDKGR